MNIRLFVILFIFSISTLVAQTKKEYKIGFLLDKTNSEIEVLLLELEKEITAVIGEDAIVKFSLSNRLVNNFNVENAQKNYDAFLEGDIDIIIAFGVINNSVVSKQTSYIKPTILFGALSRELVTNISNITNIKNFTSIVTSQSYTDDLVLLNQLANSKNIGVIVEKGFANYRPLVNVFKQISDSLKIKLTLVPFVTLSDITSNIDGYDGVYLADGFYLTNDEIKQLANVLIEKKIPSFTSTPVQDVENGIMATNHAQSELNQFFRRIALTVESVINGGDLSDVSTSFDVESGLTINFNTAEKIGVPLKYSLIATTSFVGNPKEKSADKTYTLIEVMREVIAENLDLEVSRQEVFLKEKDVQLAKSEYLPNISAGASGNYVDPNLASASNGQNPEISTSGNAKLSQTVFSESANANISIQKTLQKAQQENYNSDELDILLNSSIAYFNALILKSNLSIQNQNLELTKYNLDIATKNFEAGQTGKSDVLRFKSEVAQNTQQMLEAINQLEQAYFTLNQFLNNPIDTKIDIEEAELNKGIYSNYNYNQIGIFLDDPTLKKTFVNFLVEEAINNAPELKALDFNLQATERSERLYGSGRFLPTVALQGQYSYEFSRSGAGSRYPPLFIEPPLGFYNVGLNVSLPIFNQNKQNLNKQIASIQKNQINLNVDNLKLSVEKNINDAVLQLINEISNIQLSQVFEDTAAEALDLTQVSYANGAVNIVQLLDAQNNYLQAQVASANAAYNYLLSSMELERYLGNFFLLQTEQERQEFIKRFLEYSNNN